MCVAAKVGGHVAAIRRYFELVFESPLKAGFDELGRQAPTLQSGRDQGVVKVHDAITHKVVQHAFGAIYK